MFKLAIVLFLFVVTCAYAENDKKYIVVANIDSELELSQIELQRIFSGRVNEPIILNSDEAVIEYVRSNPGSLGFIQRP